MSDPPRDDARSLNRGAAAGSDPGGDAPPEEFVTGVMELQRPLFAFVLGMVHSFAEADDVLQEVNLVLWRKRSEYQPDGTPTSLQAWAFRIAQLQVMAWRKRQLRERLHFDDELVEQLAEVGRQQLEEVNDKREALGRCLQRLPQDDRDLLRHRYTEGLSGKQVAVQRGLSADQVYYALHRIHAALAACIRRALAVQERRT